LVNNATILGQYHHLSELMIGITIIGIGTSLPEIMVSILSAMKGSSELALGNGYGSNIANILLILGASLLICPIKIPKKLWQEELNYLSIATVITLFVLLTGTLGRLYGCLSLGIYALIILRSIQTQTADATQSPTKQATSYKAAWASVVFNFVVLMGSAQMLVWSATFIAHQLSIGDEIIGLTVVAIGTSLPELATSIAACKQKKTDLILGNVIGSNLLNTLVVIGIAACIHPIEVNISIVYRDFALMLGATLYLWFRSYIQTPKTFTRVEGIIFLLIYIGFIGMLAQHVITQSLS
ncbi:MAG: calcium/sodium antiporter, partial [Gammaproteobacteria bacterium]|nr:calcium/sodium antiporter [Gammaproteobacteria bacterium]